MPESVQLRHIASLRGMYCSPRGSGRFLRVRASRTIGDAFAVHGDATRPSVGVMVIRCIRPRNLDRSLSRLSIPESYVWRSGSGRVQIGGGAGRRIRIRTSAQRRSAGTDRLERLGESTVRASMSAAE